MKKENKVIHLKNLPLKMPLLFTVVTFLSLDHWNANDIIRGIAYAILVIIWISYLFAIYNQKDIDIFKEESEIKENCKSKFQERLEEMAKEKGIDINKN